MGKTNTDRAPSKKQMAAIFEEIAMLLELKGENPFKIRSYQNAARTLENLEEDIGVLIEEERLRDIKGIGQAIADKIEELHCTGKLQFHDDLRAEFPDTVFPLFNIQGLGPKRLKTLYEELEIDSLEKLQAACEAGRVAKLKGFSQKMQQNILQGIDWAAQQTGQHLFDRAQAAAEAVVAYLRESKAVARIAYAGSLRRHKEVVKDVDIVVASKKPADVMARFVEAPAVQRVIAHGDTKSSVVLDPGIAADLRVVSEQEYPYALMHFTGSKEHNVVMRQRAKERGLKLNEYGLFREDDKLVRCREEADIYEALGLPFIPPELREDWGEFELRETPRLVEEGDIRGLIHAHSTYSDGRNTLEEMAESARKRGYAYLLISDHSQSAAYAGGLKPARIEEQHEEIDALNKRWKTFRVLKGIESDILTDGRLDYEDDVLDRFDLVIASVHQKLTMDEDEATKRVVRAIEHPACKILGHPTGRLLLERPGYALDMERVFDACVANDCAVEINANCHRLDCDWRHLRRGKEKGVRFSIGPDAHSVDGLDQVRYGVGIARKGWLEPFDIINTMSAGALLKWAKQR